MFVVHLATTLAPLLASLGSIVVAARVYALRCSRSMAFAAIVAWCACELCTGLALQRVLGAKDERRVDFAHAFMAAYVALWVAVSVTLYTRHFWVATACTVCTLCAHHLLVGMALSSVSVAVAMLAVVGSVWVWWTTCFSVSITLYARRRAMRPLSDVAMSRMRYDMIAYNAARKRS